MPASGPARHVAGTARRGFRGARRASCAGLLWAFAAAAPACQPIVDSRPLAQRWREAPVAFIGVVMAADAGGARLRVEHALHGPRAGSEHRVAALPDDNCSLAFVPGTRWVFAGGRANDASVPLGAADPPGGEQRGGWIREADPVTALPAAWQRCSDDAQCTLLAPMPDRACSLLALRHDSLAATRRRLGAGGSDPARCRASDAPTRWPQALCVAARCGVWRLPER